MKKLSAILFALCVFAMGCTPDAVPADEKRPDLNDSANEGGSDTGGNNSDELKENPDRIIKVMSFNISNQMSGTNGWANRKEAVYAMFKEQSPTVFGLQEPLYNQINDLKAKLSDYDCYGVGRDNGKATGTSADGEIMAVFYKKDELAMGDHGTFWVAEGAPLTPTLGWNANYKRSATWAIFTHKKTEKKFFMINTHLDYKTKDGADGSDYTKAQSILLLLEQITKLNPDNFPVVITGDFNMQFSETSLIPMKNAMKDARTNADKTHHGSTNSNWGSASKIIDYIFYKDFHAWEYKVINKAYEGITYISDHYPIIATLQFE